VTLIQPLNKRQGQSFWYKSISRIIRLPIGCQFSKFCSAPFSHNTFRTGVHYRQTTEGDGRNTVA